MRRIGLIVLAAFVAVGCKASRAATQPGLPPGEVWLGADEIAKDGIAVAPVVPHDVDDALVTSGRIGFDEERVAHVLSPISGQVTSIDAQLGQAVHRGQMLASLSSPDVGGATADANKANADLHAAQHAYDRQKHLWTDKATSLEDLQQAEDAWRNAKAEYERAQEKVRLLHVGGAVTQGYALTSPIDGVVLGRNISPGEQIQGMYSGGSSPELFTVGDTDEVWVFGAVYETDLARVHAGAKVDVSVVGLPKTFTGTLDYVADMLDPQTRTASIRCTIANPEHLLRPEMYATLRVTAAAKSALAIPRSAIVHLGGTPLVFVDRGHASDGRERFERLPVDVDETGSGPWVPVAHGVDRGDRVVVKGADALSSRL